jgi:hypothetical protein
MLEWWDEAAAHLSSLRGAMAWSSGFRWQQAGVKEVCPNDRNAFGYPHLAA